METPSSIMQPPWRYTEGDDGPKPTFKPTMYGVRKSCEPCRRRKKKCDGEHPCRRCLGSRDECTYSKRSWHLPSAQQQQQPDPSGMYPSHVLQHSTSEVVRAQGMLSLKRCRLSAPPATGLVGMQENVFLSDFFTCVGFLPFTTRSYIRETMVKLMASPAILQPPGDVLYDGAGVGCSGSTATEDACRGGGGAMDPSSCVFWCAVAVGALQRVLPSNRFRTTASSRDKDWAARLGMFQEYLALSESFLRTSVEQGSSEMLPVGFAEIVSHRMRVKICCGDADTDEVASFCAPVQAPPELNVGATESELYAFVMRSYHMFEQAVYRTVYSPRGTTTRGGDGEHDSEGDQANPRLKGPSEEVMNAIFVSLREQHGQFERLEEAADRPSIRSGIGGFIMNGSLFIGKAANGDLRGSLDRIDKCVKVFERFPGLCRLPFGVHQAHMLVAALATMDGWKPRKLYDTLRTAYNSACLPGTVVLPPLAEWQGLSTCCDFFYCRTMERLLLSKEMGIASNRIDSGRTQADLNADLGGDGGALDGRPIRAGETFRAPESSLASPDIGQWGGMGDRTWDEDRLAAEDWLDAAHALFDTVADPST